MANIVITIDPDPARREKFLGRLRGKISPLPGLQESGQGIGHFHALCAASPKTPLSFFSNGHEIALIAGDAIPGPGPGRADASRLSELWRQVPEKVPEALDGFHLAAFYRPETGLVAGADPVGCFPVYYHAGKDFLLVGTSPELFRIHPDFRSRLDPKGLAGVLLTNGLVDGRTLYKDVRRLAPGHLLVWRPSSGPREIPQYRIPFSDRYFGQTFDQHLEILHDGMKEMIDRQCPRTGSLSQLFSGGLDSRLLGGYLKGQGFSPAAVTFGRENEIEMRCAKKAAQALGFPHHCIEDRTSLFEEHAALEARWRCLSNGFSCIFDWQRPPHLETDRVLSGYALETITGGSAIQRAQKPGDPKMGFDNFFKHITAWGVPFDSLGRLLKKEIFGGVVLEIKESLRKQYEGLSEREFQRPMAYDLLNRQRFHTLSVSWIHSFGAWPVLPGTDRRLIEIAAGMPMETLKDRRVQRELLRRYFRPLARLPLDRNNYDLRPIEPSLPRFVNGCYYNGLETLQKILHPIVGDRRYYYRLMNFDDPGWEAVRRRAESSRRASLEYFDETELNKVLPPPGTRHSVRNGIIDGSASRLLSGFLLWHQTAFGDK